MRQHFAATYHVIPKGNNGKTVFHDADDYRTFYDLALKFKQEFEFDLYHYTLMCNHPHMMIQPQKDDDLPKIMQEILQNYTHAYKRKYGHEGNLWRARYRRFIIGSDRYLVTCSLYIERNQVRAGLVTTPEEYRWSSAAHYIKGTDDPLISPSPIFQTLGEDDQMRRIQYKFLTMASLNSFKDGLEARKYFRRLAKKSRTSKTG